MTRPLPSDESPGQPSASSKETEELDDKTRDLRRPAGQATDIATLALSPVGPVSIPQPPPEVPGYEILEVLGRGGMGVVYKARHIQLQRVVALKMILAGVHAGDPELTRFRTEAEAVARLMHPGIVQIYEVGEHQGLPFFSLEYCAGGSLAARLNGTPLPAKQAAQLVEQLARAMNAAHRLQVIHRDLKPGNVLFNATGDPKISDFGLAKKLDEAGQTQPGSVIGTPSYMAPEQAGGQSRETGPAADVYALGAILYELLTGRPPFKAATVVDTIVQVVKEEPVAPIQLQPQTPRDLDTICLKCLQKSASKRYATAEALAEDLRRFLRNEPIHARRVGPLERSWRWCRRKPAVASLLATATLALLFGIAIGTWFALEANHERTRALDQKHQAEEARHQSEKDRDLARNAERAGLEQLLLAHLAEARAWRFSGQSGQRHHSLAALSRAVELSRRLNKPRHAFDEMRNLAIASFALPDIHLEKEWDGWPKGGVSLAFDEHLQQYARGDQNGNVTVRRIADDREVAHLPGKGASVRCAFGRGVLTSQLVLYDEKDCSFSLWDFRASKVVRVPTPPGAAVASYRLTEDGQRLVSQHKDGAFNVFEMPSGHHLRTIRFGRWLKPGTTIDEVRMCVHPFRHEMAVSMVLHGTNERELIRVLDLNSGQVLFELKRLQDSVGAMAWLRDGKTLAVGYAQTVVLWDVPGRRVIRVIDQHKGGGLYVAANSTGELVLSWSTWADGMRLWHPQTGRLLLSMPNENVFCNETARDGRLWAALHNDTRVQLWTVDPGRLCRTLVRDPARGRVGEYRLNAIHKDGRLAAVGTSIGVTLLDLVSGLDVGHLNLHHNWNVAFDPATGDLLTCGQMGLLRWPVQEVPEAVGQLRIGPPVRLPFDVRQMDHAVRISANGKTLAAVQGQRAVIFRDNDLDHPVAIEPLRIRRELAVSPDGQWIATGKFAESGELRIWSASDGKVVKAFDKHSGMNVGFSPDGKWLVANDPTHFHFYRVGTWEKGPQTPVPWKWWVNEPAFSPDGRLLALERGDGAMRLIETATGRELAVLQDPQQGRSTPAAFTPDGTQLLLTNTDHQVLRLWDLRSIREKLQTLGLDWDAPPYPPSKGSAPSDSVTPLTVLIDLGEKPPLSAASLEYRFGPLMQVGLVAGAGHKITSTVDGKTNTTVLKIDGRDVLFGSTAGQWKTRMGPLEKGTDGRERRGLKSVWVYNKIYITQLVEIVPNPRELRDTCLIRYHVENRDDQPHQIGIRVLVDTFMVDNDGHAFAVPNQNEFISTSADYRTSKEIPSHVKAVQKNDPTHPGLVAYFTLKLGQGSEAPDRFSITRWTEANQHWDIPVQDIDGDAAAVIYWNPRELKSKAQRTVGYAYGLCIAPTDDEVKAKQIEESK